MKLSKSSVILLKVILFRKLMGATTSPSLLEDGWGKEAIDLFRRECGDIDLVNRYFVKADQLKDSSTQVPVEKLLFRDWVKFIAVTGSRAAGISNGADDIDLFVVVRNGTMWVYRAIVSLRLYRRVLHVRDLEQAGKLCLNFIVEERGVDFSPGDLFTLHELLWMRPVYSPGYKTQILSRNKWLREWGLKFDEPTISEEKVPLFFRILNPFAALIQITFMLIMNHAPDLNRIVSNYRKGRIAFYPKGFRSSKLKDFESAWAKLRKLQNVEALPTTTTSTTASAASTTSTTKPAA